MNPFSRALVDYHAGNKDSAFTITRDDGFQQILPASVFFKMDHFPSIEMRALDECHGSILDIGSAAGRHSLELIRRGCDVTSLDILPEMEEILIDRGQSKVVISDVVRYSGRRFDTLLMLMNGIGMTGSETGLKEFLRHAHHLLHPGGQIVCDSIDVSVTKESQHVSYREKNLSKGLPAGQQSFVMARDGEDSVEFKWLHVDFESLARICRETEWEAALLEEAQDGHYLCKLTKQQNANKVGIGISSSSASRNPIP